MYAPHSWHRRVLFFLALQVLEFHTHCTAYDRVAPLWSLTAYILSLSLPPNHSLLIFCLRSHIPVGGTPYCFIERDQFLFHSAVLSFSVALSVSLRLIIYIYIYIYIYICARARAHTHTHIYMRFRAFHLCTSIVRTDKFRTRFAANVAEKGAKRVGRIRSNGARAER